MGTNSVGVVRPLVPIFTTMIGDSPTGAIYRVPLGGFTVMTTNYYGSAQHQSFKTNFEAAVYAYRILSCERFRRETPKTCTVSEYQIAMFLHGQVSEEEWTLAILECL